MYMRVMMGVPNPSSQLIFRPNPSSQLLDFLQSQPIIREFWQIPKSKLILANPRSQLTGIGTPVHGRWNSAAEYKEKYSISMMMVY